MNFKAGIIGFGKLGSSIGEAINEIGSLIWVVDSNETAQIMAKENLPNVEILKSIYEISDIPDFIFLTVDDSVIEKTAIELSDYLKDKLKGCFVLHCSGSMSFNVLNSCKGHGARFGAIHPYQTFFYPSKDLLRGIAWTIRTEENPKELIKIVEMLGGTSEVIPDDEISISLYHSSAVVASNFLTTLLSVAGDIARLSGINPNDFIQPIVETTVQNSMRGFDENEFPLTGPFARGDIKTIESQLNALKAHPHLLKSYCYFGLATLEMARNKNLIDETLFQKIRSILEKHDKHPLI